MPGPKATDPINYSNPKIGSYANTTVFKSRKGQLYDGKDPMSEKELEYAIARREAKQRNNNMVAREDPELAKIARFANRDIQPALDQLYKARADYRRQRDAGFKPQASTKPNVRKSSGGSVRKKLPNW